MALAAVPWALNAQTMTTVVADGTATNDYVPVYGYWADAAQHNQIVYSEEMMADIPGVTISGITFYATNSPSWGNTATISMAIVSSSAVSGLNTTATLQQVWSGSVSFSGGEWSITFDTPFNYTSGSLLVDIVTTSGSYQSCSFYGVSTAVAASYYSYNSYGSSVDGTCYFVPKTEFTHTIPTLSCYRPTDIVVSDVTTDGATISWSDTMNSGATYSIDYWANGDTATVTSSTTSYTFSGLDANTLYHFAVKSICSASDESNTTSGSFSTLCGGSTCDLTVTSQGQYSGTYYAPTLTLYQNGIELASICASTQTVSVCSTDPVVVIYSDAYYTWSSRSATILDGGGTTIFDGSTNMYSSGDTLCTITTPCPSCIPPSALFVDSVDQNNVTIGWTPRSGATLFAVYQNGTVVSESVTDTFYTFSGLSANMQYTFGVQAICSTDDSSNIATISCRTSCGAMDIPFYVDFEDAAFNGAWYPCWDSTIHAGTDPSVNDQPGGSYNPTQHTDGGLYAMYLQGNSSQNYNLVVGPEMNINGSILNVRFWGYLNNSSNWIKAGIITDAHDTSTFVPLVTITGIGSGWNEYEFNTQNITATNYRIAWLAYGTGYIGKFDDVNVSEYSGCSRPETAYAPANITSHTVDLVWSEVDGASSYIVYYGTINDATDASVQSEVVSGDTTVTIMGLNSETHYYAWVATNCGGTESDLRPFSSFHTLVSCPAVYSLNVVDSLITSDGATIAWHAVGQETEWIVVVDSSDAELVTDSVYVISGLDPMTGHTVYVRAYCGEGDTSAVSSVNFATSCEDAVCNMTVEMTDSYGDGWNNGAVNFYQAGVQVGTAALTSGNNGTASIEVCSSAAVELRVTSGNYPNEMSFIVRDGGGNAVFTASQGSISSSSNGSVLATVATPCPACVPPTNIYVGDITADEATLFWSAQEGQTNWIVRIDSTYYNVTDTSYTFTTLNARTVYTVSVATDCSGDTSSFVNVTFTTDCAGGSCDISVVMDDSYGDGWNGAGVNFYQNGVLAGTAALTGNHDTATVNVCSGIPVSFSWQSGSFDYETSYVIYDGGFTEVYNSATNGVNHSGTIDDACPTCLRPTGLVVSHIDSNQLEFEWTMLDGVQGYQASFNGGAWESANGGADNVNNLTPNTAYTFSVRAICEPGDTSTARTITVKTSCGQMVLPYTESFENDQQGDVPSCWTVVRPGYDNYPGVSSSEYTGNNGMTLAANYNDSTTIASSLVPLAGDEIHVSFWASVNQGNTLYAGVMTNLAYDSTFIPLMAIPSNNSTYTLYEFNTSTLSFYDQYYVAFRLVTGGSNHYADIDDINITQEQGCSYPTNMAANPGAHTINLTWSCAATTPDFIVEYHDNNTTVWTIAGTTFDTTYSITGLNAAVMYQVRVGLICNGDTLWAYTSVATTCDLMSLPYFENFDSYANDVMPPCWEWSNTFCTHWDGGVFFKSYHGGGSEYVVLPQLDGNITKLQIEFDCKVGTIAEQDGILFGVTDAAGVLITWLDTIQDPNHSRNAHVHHILNMLNYNVPGNAERIAFAQYRNWGEWALIDNINIIGLPDCYPVDSLEAHNLIDPDHINFTWASLGTETQWQVYVDTVTADIDSIPDSLFVDVYTRYYEIPVGTIHGGGIYTFYVRANCVADQSNWNSVTFGAGTYVMNNSSVADTVVACGLVVYDNGGPIAGYLPNSNSALVIRTENAGSELEVFGAAFGIGSSGATLNIYDGEGTTGTLLYTYNTTDGRDTLHSVLATSTTGALTITFVANGSMCHTGYELYIHCVGSALCERPTQLDAVMTGVGEADVTWSGSSASYDLYYKPTGAATWTVQSGIATTAATLTNLLPDTTYDLQVVGICGSDTSMPSFPMVLNTYYEVVITPCDPIADLTVSNVTNAEATLGWTSTASEWEIELTYLSNTNSQVVTNNPYTLTGLLPNMDYSVRVRALCNGQYVEPESDWSAAVTFHTMQNAPTTYTLTVVANNDDWGTVTGSGTYATGTEVTISATANEGYYFDRWNDGDTNATRTVTVTADVTYTANFAEVGHENTYYQVTVVSNNDAWGTVSGSGEYMENSQATITATANDGYHFVQWQNAEQVVLSTTATYTFTVIEPVTYTAIFEADDPGAIDDVVSGAMSLYPNPASTSVTLTLDGFEGQVHVDVVDMNGRAVVSSEVHNSSFEFDISALAPGAYFVRVTGERQTAVRKLIVK